MTSPVPPAALAAARAAVPFVNQDAARRILEAAAPAIAAAERERLAAVTGCITPCDDDCELQPDGCHELHQIPRKRTHLPQFCADIRAATGAAVAAGRERCAQLAEHHNVRVDMGPLAPPVPFADLLRAQP